MLTSMVKEHHKEQVKRKQEQGMDSMQFSCLNLYANCFSRGATQGGHRSLQRTYPIPGRHPECGRGSGLLEPEAPGRGGQATAHGSHQFCEADPPMAAAH